MTFLGRIPLWGWYLFSAAYLYALSFGFLPLMRADVALVGKAAAALLVFAIAYLYWTEGRKAFSPVGLALMFAVISLVLWTVYYFTGTMGYVQYWWQLIGAFVLMVAIRWGQVYRVMTGRVPVDPSNPAHAGISPNDVIHPGAHSQ